MNQFLANPSLPISILYYATCLLNFTAALWLATSVVRMRGGDIWLFRMAITIAGMLYVIITISMLKTPEYGPHATTLVWWWLIALLGLMVLLQPLKLVGPGIMRSATYVGAILALWGAYMVSSEQVDFGELATYYGFYGANLSAATWIIFTSLFSQDLIRRKRLILMSTGVIYAVLVVTAVETMQMVLESPY